MRYLVVVSDGEHPCYGRRSLSETSDDISSLLHSGCFEVEQVSEDSSGQAIDAMLDLLAELPAEFSERMTENSRDSFSVVKKKNVRAVHRALDKIKEFLYQV